MDNVHEDENNEKIEAKLHKQGKSKNDKHLEDQRTVSTLTDLTANLNQSAIFNENIPSEYIFNNENDFIRQAVMLY